MPTYDFRCQECEREYSVYRTIREHCFNPRPFVCCGQTVERWFTPGNTGAALNNALAGDRHYEGLRATDGTDISTRTKHREYMKRHNLTTIDDFKDTWAQAQKKRDEYRRGEGHGAITRNDIAQVIADLGDR
jgi:hypothetical protein